MSHHSRRRSLVPSTATGLGLLAAAGLLLAVSSADSRTADPEGGLTAGGQAPVAGAGGGVAIEPSPGAAASGRGAARVTEGAATARAARTGRICLMALGTHPHYRLREGGPVDLLVVSPEDKPRQALEKARGDHPGVKVFGYLNTMDLMLSRRPEPASFWKKNEDWFLHDSGGERVRVRIKNYRGDLSRFGMNVAHPGYQEWLGREAVALLEAGYDGIQLDNVETDSSYKLRYVGSFISAVPVEMDDERWIAGEKAMLRKIREVVHAAGYRDREIIFNHIRSGEPEVAAAYLEEADGANAEAWMSRKVGADGRWGWRARVDLARRAARDGKRTNLLCEASLLSREEALFAYASFLFTVEGDRNTFWYGRPYRVDEMPWFDFYDADLGAPAGEFHAVAGSGVFRRDFEKGVVLVNPDGEEHLADLGAPFWNEIYEEVARIEIGGQSGAILLKPGPAAPQRVVAEAETCLAAGSPAALELRQEPRFSGGAAVRFAGTSTACAVAVKVPSGRWRLAVEGAADGPRSDAVMVRAGGHEKRLAFALSRRQVVDLDLPSGLSAVDLKGAEPGVFVDRVVLVRLGDAR